MSNPIGIFDSGLGGLSVAHAIRKILPSESLIYVADQAFSPYGCQPKALIQQRCESVVRFLKSQGCKAIVVACNTATVNSIIDLRKQFNMPIIGVEPGIKPAVLKSKNSAVGVLATTQTLNSESFCALKKRYGTQANIEVQACPGLVSLVEEVNLSSEHSLNIVKGYVEPLLNKGCDQIILGCTHYSFLKPGIEQVINGRADIIDTAQPVALEVKRRLFELGLIENTKNDAKVKFYSSESSAKIAQRMSQLWGSHVQLHSLTKDLNSKIKTAE